MDRIMNLTKCITNDLQQYDLILLIQDGRKTAENLTEHFLASEALRNTRKKVLVLSDQPLSYPDPDMHHAARHGYRRLSPEELEAVLNLYYMYEFSDHFHVIADSPQYGSLLNYVRTGEMTLEEVFQAVLGS